MKLKIKILLLLFFAVMVNAQQTVKNYYVSSSTGSDANDGLTWQTAFKTLDKVLGQGENDENSLAKEASTIFNVYVAKGNYVRNTFYELPAKSKLNLFGGFAAPNEESHATSEPCHSTYLNPNTVSTLDISTKHSLFWIHETSTVDERGGVSMRNFKFNELGDKGTAVRYAALAFITGTSDYNSFTMDRCIVNGYKSTAANTVGGGGIICVDGKNGEIKITNSVIHDGKVKTAGVGGGFLYVRDQAVNIDLEIKNSNFYKNHSGGNGGATSLIVYDTEYSKDFGQSTIRIEDSKFCENTHTWLSLQPAGLLRARDVSSVVLQRNFFSKNYGGIGGAFAFNSCGKLESFRNVYAENYAYNDGGAIQMWGDKPNDAADAVFPMTATFTNDIFTKNTSSKGGAIYSNVNANIIFKNTSFIDNGELQVDNTTYTTGDGGALYFGKGTVSIISDSSWKPNLKPNESIFCGNKSVKDDGGAIYTENDVALTIDKVSFIGNTSKDNGGALYVKGALDLNKCYFKDNTSGGNGGAIDAKGSTTTLKDLYFEANTSEGYGGAMSVISTTSTLKDLYFKSNVANGNSGAAYIKGTSTSDGLFFEANSSKANFGAMHVEGTSDLKNVHFKSNSADGYGGAMHAEGTSTLNKVYFISNTATGISGGISAGNSGALYVDGTTTLNDVHFNSNTAKANYGAIHVRGTSTLTNVYFKENSAENGDGGAMYAQGPSTLTNVSFVSNSATKNGGGLYVNGSSTLSNLHFIGNSTDYEGGALYIWGSNGDVIKSTSNIYESNTAVKHGGAILFYHRATHAPKFTIDGDIFYKNKTTTGDAFGGALMSTGDGAATMKVLNSNFAENEAKKGGAYYTISHRRSIIKFDNNEFLSNSAVTEGGAIYVANRGTFYEVDLIENCKFYNNKQATFNNVKGADIFMSDPSGGISDAWVEKIIDCKLQLEFNSTNYKLVNENSGNTIQTAALVTPTITAVPTVTPAADPAVPTGYVTTCPTVPTQTCGANAVVIPPDAILTIGDNTKINDNITDKKECYVTGQSIQDKITLSSNTGTASYTYDYDIITTTPAGVETTQSGLTASTVGSNKYVTIPVTISGPIGTKVEYLINSVTDTTTSVDDNGDAITNNTTNFGTICTKKRPYVSFFVKDCSDTDGDGIADAVDLDDDNDGILDTNEQTCTAQPSNLIPTNLKSVVENGVTYYPIGTGSSTYNPVILVDLGGSYNTGTEIKIAGYHDIPSIGNLEGFKIFEATGTNLSTDVVGFGSVSAFDTSTTERIYTLTKDNITHILIRENLEGANPAAIRSVSLANGGGSIFVCEDKDTDGDGIPNRLDLDSDNDGCPDALEGSASLTSFDLVTSGGVLHGGNGTTPATTPTSGTYNLAVKKNLCATAYTANGTNCVGSTGIPTKVDQTTGQGVGASQDANDSSACLDSDGDGVVDIEDLDDDNDGILDTVENDCSFVRVNPISLVSLNSTNSGTLDVSAQYGYSTGTILLKYENVHAETNNGESNFYVTNNPDGTGTLSESKFELVSTIPVKLRLSHGKFITHPNTSDYFKVKKFKNFVKNFTINNNFIYTKVDSQEYVTHSVKKPAGNSLSESGASSTDTGLNFDSDKEIKSAIFTVGTTDWGGKVSNFFLELCVPKDTDSDGTPDYLDLDSDNDGCPDATEGSANLIASNTAVSTLTDGNGGQVTKNLTTTAVNTYGVPTVAGAGQDVGKSLLASDSTSCICTKAPNTSATGELTNHGITTLQRAGKHTGDTSVTLNKDWPMVRKGAWTVLESKTKGFVITRMDKADLGDIQNPQDGMMIYDKTDKCLKIYIGTKWSCFSTPGCPTP